MLATNPLTLIFKFFLLAVLLIYIVFALVVVRQVATMNKTLDVGIETQIAIASYIHLAFAVGVFLIALVIL